MNKNSKAEQLVNMSFDTSKILIHKMDIHEKAKVAKEIDEITLHLYEAANDYGQFDRVPGVPFPIPRMSTENYMAIMGKIKRYESLLNDLYEVNEMLEQEHILEKLRKAEDELVNCSYNEDRKYWLAKIDSYRLDFEASACHTDAILDFAAALTGKFFNTTM